MKNHQTFEQLGRAFRAIPKLTISTRAFLGLLLAVATASAAPVNKANNADALNLTTSWAGGSAPTGSDVAVWDSAVTAANAPVLGANANWGGIQISNPGGAVTIAATVSATLTNGASGIDMSAATTNLTIACLSYLGSPQTWNIADVNPAGAALTVSGVISGPSTSTLTKSGAGRLVLSANANAFTNDVNVDGGTLSATVAASNTGNTAGTPTALGRLLPTRTITVNSGGTLTFTNSNDVFASGNSTAVCPAPKIVVNAGGTLRAGRLLATGGGYGNNMGKLTLNGGSVILNQGNSATFGPAILTDTVTVGGAAASTVSSAMGDNSFMNLGYRSSLVGITFDVADATGDATADLTISVPLKGAANTTVAATTPALTKTGNGTLTLSAANIYTGKTIVNAGTLALTGSATIASTYLEFSGAGTFDVTGLSGSSYTFASAKVLADSASSGTATINATGGSVTLAAGALASFTAAGGGSPTAGKISVNGDLTLNNNAVTVNVTGAALGAGTYRLMECTGNLNGAANSSPTIIGAGLVIGCTVSIVTTAGTGGTVDLVVTAGVPKNLIWVGDGSANLWDTTTANWTGDSTVFAPQDIVTINDTGSNVPAVDLVGAISSSLVTVSNVTKDFTIGSTTAGSLTGGGGLTKVGAGKLTLTTTNTFTGKTIVNGGTLSISSDGNLGTAPSIVVANHLTVNGATLTVTANTLLATNRGVVLGAAGSTFSVPTGVNCIEAAVVSGPGSLTKTDNGTLTMAALNSYEGNLTINGGVVAGTATGGAGNGTYLAIASPFGMVTNSRTITINSGGILSLNTGNIFAGGQTTVVAPAPQIIVNQGGTLRTVINDGNNFAKINLNGGTFELGTGNGAVYGAAILTDTITVGGSVASLIVSNGAVNSSANLGYRTSTVGVTFDVADVTGNANPDLVINAPLRNAANTVVPTNNVSLVKTGVGTLQLNGANLYTGQTVVSNGTLAGIGFIAGPVNVTANGNLAPGNSIGTLTINGTIALGGTVTVEVNTNASPNCDQIVGATAIAYGGSLVVQNLGAGLEIGNSFQIFPATTATGSFASITPSPGAGKAWSFNPATGVLSVVSDVVAPPTLGVAQAGNALTFSWSGAFKLQSQTNNLGAGFSTNSASWFNYPDTNNPVNVTIDPANPTVFFRLKN